MIRNFLANTLCKVITWPALPYLAIKLFMLPTTQSKDGSTFLSDWHRLTSTHLMITFDRAQYACREHLKYNLFGFMRATINFYSQLKTGFALAKANTSKIDQLRENLPNFTEQVTLKEKSISHKKDFDKLYKKDFLPVLQALEKEIAGERVEFYKKIKSPTDWDNEENRQEYLTLMKKALSYHKLLLKQVAILGGFNPIVMATILQNQGRGKVPYRYAYSIFTFNHCSITDLYKDFRAKRYCIETTREKPHPTKLKKNAPRKKFILPTDDLKVTNEYHLEVYQKGSLPCQFRELYNEACAEFEKYQVILPLSTPYLTSYKMHTHDSRIVNWFQKDESNTFTKPEVYSAYHSPDQRPT